MFKEKCYNVDAPKFKVIITVRGQKSFLDSVQHIFYVSYKHFSKHYLSALPGGAVDMFGNY